MLLDEILSEGGRLRYKLMPGYEHMVTVDPGKMEIWIEHLTDHMSVRLDYSGKNIFREMSSDELYQNIITHRDYLHQISESRQKIIQEQTDSAGKLIETKRMLGYLPDIVSLCLVKGTAIVYGIWEFLTSGQTPYETEKKETGDISERIDGYTTCRNIILYGNTLMRESLEQTEDQPPEFSMKLSELKQISDSISAAYFERIQRLCKIRKNTQDAYDFMLR